MLENGTLASLHAAFSREGEEKVYVQTLMAAPQRQAELWQLLGEQGGSLIVAGNSKLPSGVKAAVAAAFAANGGLSTGESTKLLRSMERTGRLLVECW